MFLWFVGCALVLVWIVFHDPAVDHRVLVLGAVLPDLIDAPLGGARIAHTVLASAVLLGAVMMVTRGRRATRRRWLALPIGTFVHLLADAVWAREKTFWWPFLGGDLTGPLPSLDRSVGAVVLQEVAGAAAIVWFVWRFGLVATPAARKAFVRTGRLPRDRMG